MADVQRPLSPHLSVYRPQFTTVLSIFTRITGIALSFGAVGLVAWLLAVASGPAAFADAQAVLGSWIGILALLVWTVSLAYHTAAGIRHLVWDTGLALEIHSTYRSGYLVLAATVAITAIVWLAGLVVWGGL